MRELSSLDGGKPNKSAVKSLKRTELSGRGKADLRPLYAFGITLLLYIAAMLLYDKYPLGKNNILLSDLEAQYAPFLALMRSKIAELKNIPFEHRASYLSYSFKLGLGKNFAGTLGYYLASPFNLIYLLLDESQINTAVIFIMILKLCLSSGFMCLFLSQKTDNKKTLWPVLLGIMYAFSLYSQAFIFHIMWLDGYMLFPLILFFTEKFIKKQKYSGLIVSLLVLFVSNYYIAYMAGIACFLYLVIRLFIEKTDLKKAAGICVKYVLTAGFTALLTAVMLVPAGLDTIRNSEQISGSGSKEVISYSPITLIHMFILGEPGEFNDLMPSNYPFLFICLPVTMLMILYFLSPVFKGRERKAHAVCLLGVLLSTAVYPLDKAWHVFDDPNWFWHRQAFVFLPLFLVISLNVLLKIKDLAKKDLLKTMLIMYAFVVIDYTVGRIAGKSVPAMYNFCFITAYSALFAAFKVEKWPDQLHDMPRMIAPLLSVITCFELFFASPAMSTDIEPLTLNGGSAADYIVSLKAEKEFGDYANARCKYSGAFRADTEKTPDFTEKNYIEDGEALYGNYNGLSFFNSNSNKKMHRFIKQMGLPTNYNYFAAWHTVACPSIDSFFSIGSVSARKDISFYRLEQTDKYGTGLMFYANDNFLPLAFAADSKAYDFDFYRLEKETADKDFFVLQNDWYRSLFPDEFTEDFFVEISEDKIGTPRITNGAFFNSSDYVNNKDLIQTGSDTKAPDTGSMVDLLGLEKGVASELNANTTDIYRSNKNIPIVVEYEISAPSSDELYCAIAGGRLLDSTKIYVNGVKAYDFSSNTYYSQIFRLGSFRTGEKVTVTFICDEDKWSYLNIDFAAFDNGKFSEQLSKVDRTKVNLEQIIDGYARFNINNIGADETVITTIPAEDGWKLYIDGTPAEYKVYQNAFIAFDVPSGEHTAELVFTAPGLKTGALVSCAGVVLLAAFVLIEKRNSKVKEKQK